MIDAAAAEALAARAAAVQRASGDVPSPCSSVCRMDAASGLCAGCLRSIDEIAAWSRLDDAARRRVWGAIEWRARSGATAAMTPAGADPSDRGDSDA